ncbi:S66 family peptidase [Paenibacillus soyae]|uniref:LD-carboxypeptidase n=1 Tax=Paenibacillus soyae TaxID=2969249 RepID=A0A9X2MS22_9BACL|nr:S66 peptidase family protein [Paenibacillus soyae]MCR2805139.1 LD-carboxypeptidase [Paenibacillus soyae]
MIRYPLLEEGTAIGVTAPSSGVPKDLHELLRQSCARMEREGFRVFCGETPWIQRKAKSAPARVRAAELNAMMSDDGIGLILPPWGGELLIEMLEFMDWDGMKSKWVLGYSDTSALLLAITLRTGIATAHGTNLIDLRGEHSDPTTAMWRAVLSTKTGESVLQRSSVRYQKEWDHANPSPCVFHLTEPTEWKTLPCDPVLIKGRLLGGCIDIIRHLIGTLYGDVRLFQKQMIHNEPIIWYFENCELSSTDLRRSLVQMRLAGWFEHCAGILFGRSGANRAVEDYTEEDAYRELSEELGLPIVYDIDCGHVPPQITFVNGAHAEVEAGGGSGTIVQTFNT